MAAKVEVIDIKQEAEWIKRLKQVSAYDFYHTFSYHNYYNKEVDKAVLFCFEEDEYSIYFPLIIRHTGFNDYYDVTSVYGYPGPLSSHIEIPKKITLSFSTALTKYFIQNNIVSAFSRLHPSLKNEVLLDSIGELLSLSETVHIDLSLPTDSQRKGYRKGVKSDISKLNRENYLVIEDKEKKYVEEFITIYNENMVRVGAREDYFFSKAYYEMIFNSPDINSKLYFVVKENIKVAAAIFIFTGKIIQYHLSATKEEYLRNSPVRLLIDYVRLYGSQNGYLELHLGGGVGSTEDSLFKFKAGFSNSRQQFKVWRYIVNPTIYDQLVKMHNPDPNSNYFPLYRAPKQD